MTSSVGKSAKASIALRQPAISCLVRELRQLMQLTQVQFAAELGVAYETINRWENGHMQPSALALKQLRSLLEQLHHASSEELKQGSKALLTKYFIMEAKTVK
ncbi:helix-turn-helix domain-containing protein [Pantanalinema rosaneae CENA516]|uniref:helix-turn-helix domain-containing protein n=1 Tax=Pantanalinema rosaneae TaxID=1620701 RepID=UPI003D6E9A24